MAAVIKEIIAENEKKEKKTPHFSKDLIRRNKQVQDNFNTLKKFHFLNKNMKYRRTKYSFKKKH